MEAGKSKSHWHKEGLGSEQGCGERDGGRGEEVRIVREWIGLHSAPDLEPGVALVT